jgi:NADPH:quinone reductase-like Zn-dependent oxidoreductase
MRAAVLHQESGPPVVEEFAEPSAGDGQVLIHVETAGLGGWDILKRYQFQMPYPSVIRGEGVGQSDDGRRVYFGEHSAAPFGAWAQQTVVPAHEVWEVPDGVSDRLAITMAIAGTGAIVPLEQAEIQPGESVLVLGATGALGQLALQFARQLGAGRVVGAGRNRDALDRLLERGIADDVVQMGNGDDAAALKAAAGEGFDVVLDQIYGDAFLAALRATRKGARVMVVGVARGNLGMEDVMTVPLSPGDMLSRTLTCVGTGQRAPEDRRAIWERLLELGLSQGIDVDYREFTLDDAAQAWALQAASPHAKVVGTI